MAKAASTLEWHCSACDHREPVEPDTGYDAGDSEPCVFCADGVSVVRVVADGWTVRGLGNGVARLAVLAAFLVAVACNGQAVDEPGRTCEPLAFEQPRELVYEWVGGDCNPLSRPAYQPPMAVPNCEILLDQVSPDGCHRDLAMHCRNGDVEGTNVFEIEQRGDHLVGHVAGEGFCSGEWTFKSGAAGE